MYLEDELSLIMDPKIARQKLASYEEQCRRVSDEELERTRDAYAELAKGKAIVFLSQAFELTPEPVLKLFELGENIFLELLET